MVVGARCGRSPRGLTLRESVPRDLRCPKRLYGRKANYTLRIERSVKHGVVVVHQRQPEDGLVCRIERPADLEGRLTGTRKIQLPICLRRAGELDVLAVLAGQREIDIRPLGQ